MGGYRRGIAPPAAGARQACERWGECDRVTLDGGNVKNWVKVLWVAVVTAISTIVVARLNSSTQGRAARDARVFEHRKRDIDELKEGLVQLFALGDNLVDKWKYYASQIVSDNIPREEMLPRSKAATRLALSVPKEVKDSLDAYTQAISEFIRKVKKHKPRAAFLMSDKMAILITPLEEAQLSAEKTMNQHLATERDKLLEV